MATSTIGVKFEGKQRVPATGTGLPQTTNMAFQSKGTGEECGGSFLKKNSPKPITSAYIEKEAVVATAVDRLATLWQMSNKRDREKLLEGDVREADEPVEPYQLTLSTPYHVQETAACVFETLLAALSTGAQDNVIMILARLVQKALDSIRDGSCGGCSSEAGGRR